MTRSLRRALASRSALLGAGLCLLFGVTCVIALRTLLLAQLDETLVQLAQVEASAGASATSEAFTFHESVLLTERGASANPLTRYAEVWTADGQPVVRSRNLREDLPVEPSALAAVRDGRPRFMTLERRGERFRSVVFPLVLVAPAHSVHVLQVAAPMAPLQATLSRFAWLVASLAALASLGVYGIGWRVASLALQPVLDIIEQAERLGANDLSQRIVTRADTDELRRLGSVLNGMLARLERLFDSQRRFTADASHELRAPITALRTEIEVSLKRERSIEELRLTLRRCLEDVRRLGRLAADLLTLARADGLPPTSVAEGADARALVTRVVQRERARAAEQRIEIVAEGEDALLKGDDDALERALGNLVENALLHGPSGGRVEIRFGRAEGQAWIEVASGGAGVPEHLAPQLFTRFFRGDAARSAHGGSGLGLAIARAEMERLGGTVEFVGNKPGAVFRLTCPAVAPEQADSTDRGAEHARGANGPSAAASDERDDAS